MLGAVQKRRLGFARRATWHSQPICAGCVRVLIPELSAGLDQSCRVPVSRLMFVDVLWLKRVETGNVVQHMSRGC